MADHCLVLEVYCSLWSQIAGNSFLFKTLQLIADSFIDKQMANKICSTEIVEVAILEVYTQIFFVRPYMKYRDGPRN